MRRAAAVLLAVWLSGCSVLFDPSKVDSGLPACPSSPAGCPARANATASCSGSACAYACAQGFADSDGDLADGGATGCERDCTSAVAPSNPPFLVAGVGASGTVQFAWLEATPPPDAYKLCPIADAGPCTLVPRAACAGGVCGPPAIGQVTGLTDNARYEATVVGANACGQLGAPPTRTSYTPINGQSKFGYQIDSACNATITDIGSGVLQVAQNGFNCATIFQTGDDQWGDGTAEVDMNLAQATRPDAVGLAMQTSTSTGHVVAASSTLRDLGECSEIWSREGTGLPSKGASSVYCPPANTWITLRLTASGGTFSMSAGPQGGPLREVLRWPSPIPGAPTRKGRVGFFLYSFWPGNKQALFRNFRLLSRAETSPPAPTSVAYSIPAPGFPSDWRVHQGDALDAVALGCPSTFLAASNCALGSGCAPAAGSNCIHLRHVNATGGAAYFDLPVGIDVTQPYSLSMRLAATPGGYTNPQLVATTHGPLLDVNSASGPNLYLADQDAGTALELDRWNHAAFRFIADGGAGWVELRLNGQAPITVPRPQSWDRHSGAIRLGGAPLLMGNSDLDAYITDVQVSQP